CLFAKPGYSQPPQETLKIAIIPHRSNLGNEQAYSTLFSELTKETGIKFDWLGSKTYDDVIHKIRTGDADFGLVGPFAYVTAQDSFGVKILCRTLSKGGEEFYRSMIISRKDSGIQHLQDLKGKSFSFTDPKSTSGYLFPMARLKAAGIAEEDFADVRYLKRHANSLLAVYKGHVDAGATSSTAKNKVDINMDEIRIVWQSEPIYRGLWVARKDLPEEQFNKIQEAMLKISASENSRAIFDGLTTKGFIMGRDSDYDNVREVIKWMGEK
ncbi:MAG: phosphate/phosphite/phosphonate ABC transporter substrate-binding protein, partial [Desulforhopalus sp.]